MSYFEEMKIVDAGDNVIESQLIDAATDDLDGKYGLVTAAGIYGRTGDLVRPIGIDAATHALMTIDYAHHEIHSGSHFFIKDYVDSLSNGQVYDFLVIVPDTLKRPHTLIHFDFEAEATYELYEGTTVSDNGTALTSFNNNRNSATAATTLAYHTPTVTGVGTRIAGSITGSRRRVGGDIRSEGELILDQANTYLLRITNNTTSSNWMDYHFVWYEHTDKD